MVEKWQFGLVNNQALNKAFILDMLENEEVMAKLKAAGPFDVGIAELALPNEYALAVFEALQIPHTVVTKGGIMLF